MHLEIKQANDRTEQVSSTCIDKLYNLSKNGLLDATSDLRGNINATTAYEDAVTFLNTMWGPNLIVTASAYYIRFADPEAERLVKAALGKELNEGVLASELSSFRPNFNGNTVILYFDEMKYCSPNVLENAFYGCTNLKSIDLTNITAMSSNGNYFRDCINLEYFHGIDGERGVLNLTNLTNAIFNRWFCNCKKLERITSLGFISAIGGWAFTDCSALESVTGISSVTSIYNNAFENCSSLSIITLQSITSISEGAFNTCSNLEYCGGPDSTQGELNLPNLTGTLGNDAFKGCSKLTSIASLGSITSIGGSAFENCTNLATINFPSTITSVGGNAFNNTAWYNSQPNGPVYTAKVLYKCKNVSGDIVIPNNIVSISEGAFEDCSSLTSVTIGSGVASIGVARVGGIFEGCAALSTIVVDSNNATYDSRDNCSAIIETASNKLIACCKNSTFPAPLNSLGTGCFKQSPKVLDFTDQNSGLSNINITNVGETLFRGGNFEEVYFPDTVTTVGWGAFQYCKSLKKVDFGSGITSFSGAVFNGTQLSPSTADITVVIRAITPPSIDTSTNNTFNYSAVHHIQVPASVVQTYKDVWGNAGLPDEYLNMIESIPTT